MRPSVLIALLATSLVACGGGGGSLSPLAPGAVAPAATPTPTLAVAPKSNTFPAVGATRTVTATLSTGQAGVAVTYTGGCENVATVSPSTQSTGAGGVTPAYTETAVTANSSCQANFAAADGAQGFTGVGIGSATPPPTPSPSPSPSPTSLPTVAPTVPPTATPTPTIAPTPSHAIVVSPSSLKIGNTDPTTATATVTDTGWSGSISIDASGCTGIASVTPSSGSGPVVTLVITQIAGGSCQVGASDGYTAGTLTITSTTIGVTVQ